MEYDPRPDLSDDHELWEKLLSKAKTFNLNRNLFWILHGFRCGGARLTNKPHLKLILDNFVKEDPNADIDALKARWLEPNKTWLKILFKKVK